MGNAAMIGASDLGRSQLSDEDTNDQFSALRELDAIVHALGIEDSNREAVTEIEALFKRAETAEAELAAMRKVVEAKLVPKLQAVAAGWGEPRHSPRVGFTGERAGITCGDIYEFLDALAALTPRKDKDNG